MRTTLIKCGFRNISYVSTPWSHSLIQFCLKHCSSHALPSKIHICILAIVVLRWKWTCPRSAFSIMIHRPSKSNADSEMVQSIVRSESTSVCPLRYAGIVMVACSMEDWYLDTGSGHGNLNKICIMISSSCFELGRSPYIWYIPDAKCREWVRVMFMIMNADYYCEHLRLLPWTLITDCKSLFLFRLTWLWSADSDLDPIKLSHRNK